MTKILMILFNEILIPLYWKARNRHNYTIIYKFFFISFFDNNCCYNRSNKKSPKVTVKATVKVKWVTLILQICVNLILSGQDQGGLGVERLLVLDWTGLDNINNFRSKTVRQLNNINIITLLELILYSLVFCLIFQ